MHARNYISLILALLVIGSGCRKGFDIPTDDSGSGAAPDGGGDGPIIIDTNTRFHPAFGVVVTPGGNCVGSLIGRRTVLTAAHCVFDWAEGTLPTPFQFVLPDPHETIDVESVHIAPSYDPDRVDPEEPRAALIGDLAVLRLVATPQTHPIAIPIRLPLVGEARVESIDYQSDEDVSPPPAGIQRWVDATASGVTSVFFDLDPIPAPDLPDDDAGAPPCVLTGSGGPTLFTFSDVTMVVGIHVAHQCDNDVARATDIQVQALNMWIASVADRDVLVPGDANSDGCSDFDDFTKMGQNFGKEVAGVLEGDLSGDGVVDNLDFLILESHFGNCIALLPEDS